jgi:hypothetical protein
MGFIFLILIKVLMEMGPSKILMGSKTPSFLDFCHSVLEVRSELRKAGIVVCWETQRAGLRVEDPSSAKLLFLTAKAKILWEVCTVERITFSQKESFHKELRSPDQGLIVTLVSGTS